MKKILLSICLLLLMTVTVAAQKTNKKQKEKTDFKHEIGFNMTQLLANLFGQERENNERFSLVYKYHTSPKFAFRAGIGCRVVNGTQTINDTDQRNNTMQVIKGRIGLERRREIANKWTLFFGIDAIASYDARKTTFDSNFDKVVSSVIESRYGLSPLLGLEFKINERIRLSAELTYSINKVFTREEDVFDRFPEFDTIEKSERNDFRLESPDFLYLTIRL